MKKLIIFCSVLLLMSCQNKNQDNFGTKENTGSATEIDFVAKGKSIFEGVGNCKSCHLPDQKVIGPSIKDIAEAYKTAGANMVLFLKAENEPIMDLENFEVMKINLDITKKMSDDELKALEAYILSH